MKKLNFLCYKTAALLVVGVRLLITVFVLFGHVIAANDGDASDDRPQTVPTLMSALSPALETVHHHAFAAAETAELKEQGLSGHALIERSWQTLKDILGNQISTATKAKIPPIPNEGAAANDGGGSATPPPGMQRANEILSAVVVNVSEAVERIQASVNSVLRGIKLEQFFVNDFINLVSNLPSDDLKRIFKSGIVYILSENYTAESMKSLLYFIDFLPNSDLQRGIIELAPLQVTEAGIEAEGKHCASVPLSVVDVPSISSFQTEILADFKRLVEKDRTQRLNQHEYKDTEKEELSDQLANLCGKLYSIPSYESLQAAVIDLFNKNYCSIKLKDKTDFLDFFEKYPQEQAKNSMACKYGLLNRFLKLLPIRLLESGRQWRKALKLENCYGGGITWAALEHDVIRQASGKKNAALLRIGMVKKARNGTTVYFDLPVPSLYVSGYWTEANMELCQKFAQQLGDNVECRFINSFNSTPNSRRPAGYADKKASAQEVTAYFKTILPPGFEIKNDDLNDSEQASIRAMLSWDDPVERTIRQLIDFSNIMNYGEVSKETVALLANFLTQRTTCSLNRMNRWGCTQTMAYLSKYRQKFCQPLEARMQQYASNLEVSQCLFTATSNILDKETDYPPEREEQLDLLRK